MTDRRRWESALFLSDQPVGSTPFASAARLHIAAAPRRTPPRYSRLAAAPDFPFDPGLLRHVSPIEWKNGVLYGEIKIQPSSRRSQRGPPTAIDAGPLLPPHTASSADVEAAEARRRRRL